MSKQVKLFVVEGENRETRFLQWMIDIFFQGRFAAKIITLSAAQNIYMLYQILKKDDFETDMVEVLRDYVDAAKKQLEGISRQDISEIYMFFDYDLQQNNLRDCGNANDILEEMLSVFDNETENGKLYISYPMVEALYDYRDKLCQAYSTCYIDVDQLAEYKTISGNGNPKASLHFRYDDWKEILNVFTLRVKCLLDLKQIGYEYYQTNIDPAVVFRKQNQLREERDQVFVLSGFPEFLLDYFKHDFWNTVIKRNKPQYDYCLKENMW